ncbi:MAG TPA: hypothetical protein VFW98_16290 [Gemmatimonadaceae bacterium]|nr:hypothetical protein [Gemmatimonadaceae bacterium]
MTDEVLKKITRTLRKGGMDAAQPPHFSYGFALSAAAYGDRAAFAITTIGGERLPLTERLLAPLETMPAWIYGSVATFFSADSHVRPEPSEIVRRLRLTLLISPGLTHPKDFIGLQSLLTPADLSDPLVAVMPRMPHGWPR